MNAAIQAPHKCLLALAREQGCNRSIVEALFKLHLISLDSFLRQKDGLTPDQIEFIAEEVMSSYGGMLNFADIHVIFRNAKLGKYGELYNQLSAVKIMRWFSEYADQRCNMAYQINLQKDREAYSGNKTPSAEEALRNLGYKIGEDGKIMTDEQGKILFDKKVIENNDKKRKEIEEEKRIRLKNQMDEDNEIMKAMYVRRR